MLKVFKDVKSLQRCFKYVPVNGGKGIKALRLNLKHFLGD